MKKLLGLVLLAIIVAVLALFGVGGGDDHSQAMYDVCSRAYDDTMQDETAARRLYGEAKQAWAGATGRSVFGTPAMQFALRSATVVSGN